MKTDIRIVAGSLKGRRISCVVTEDLRPTPQMVREALFSILGNAVPDRLFVDLFAGTGVNGLEAISRGASMAYFVERDFRLAQGIENYLRNFQVQDRTRLYRTDVYRWVSAWRAPAEPANVFLSPPFADLGERPGELIEAVHALQEKLAEDSVIILQAERGSPLDGMPELSDWEERKYGRNLLLLWQKEITPAEPLAEASEPTT